MELFKVAGFPFRASSSLFGGEQDREAQREIFKQSVSRVVLEISSYCNRQCVFCPNSDGSRLGKEARLKSMPISFIESIAAALAEIDYDQVVLLHLYNEPMSDPDLIAKLKAIRRLLPKAKISFNSNGDYLTKGILEELTEAGLTYLSVSLYGPQHGLFDVEYLEGAFERIFNIVGNRSEIRKPRETQLEARVSFSHAGRTLPINVFATDFNQVGYDRGKAVRTQKDEQRVSPCPAPFAELNIAWDGHVVPCCNIHPERAVADGQTVGRVIEGHDIFRIFNGRKMKGWRRSLALYGNFSSPCDTCTRLNEPGACNSAAALSHNERMRKILEETSALA